MGSIIKLKGIKIIKVIGYCLFLVVTVVLLLEAIYRLYLFDFYKKEFNTANSNVAYDESKPYMLVFGDSFSAGPESYVQTLRRDYSNINIVNPEHT